MSEQTRVRDFSPSIYINLLAAHGTLAEMRDQMRSLTKVIESLHGPDARITIRPEVLLGCVSDLAGDLAEVAEAVRWSKEACFGGADTAHPTHIANESQHAAAT